ncbi:MAG: hypothetical protein L0241_21985 [Planctomycetia bacterium]|nr:hypothetical protein [Planctomycetia bacterium]
MKNHSGEKSGWVRIILFCIPPLAAACGAVLLFMFIEYATNHGMKSLQYRIISQPTDDQNRSQRIDVAVTSPKDGFVTVLAVKGSAASLIRPCDPKRQIYKGVEYVIEDCFRPDSGFVFVVVTQTVIPDQIVDSINRQLRSLGDNISKPEALRFAIYFALGEQGHKWVCLAHMQ